MAPALRSLPQQQPPLQRPPPPSSAGDDEDGGDCLRRRHSATGTAAAATQGSSRRRRCLIVGDLAQQQQRAADAVYADLALGGRRRVAEQEEEGSEGTEGTAMGSSNSRQPGKPGGLLGRRTQSSGSLCGARADKLGRLLAPCGRHRHPRHHHHCHHEHAGHDEQHADNRRHLRYKLCGSLPNHLGASQLDLRDACDNNNITPASPAASEKDLLDLGYASERSPDEERHFPGDMSGACESVALVRGSRGLGLSVCGGVDCSVDGLVRVKRLFPHQPAWQSGRLRPGDVLLAVNGEPLSGLTNHEALEVLRTAPDHVVLTVARPSRPPSWAAPNAAAGQDATVAPSSAASRQAKPPQFLQLQQHDPRLQRQDSCGELELSLSKVQGSLGFTLRKEDSSALGHYVRALVREPALSDGRIRPGDKIVAVNGVDICHMSHEEAVLFLRQAGDTVRLRLYRDLAQTPVAALSPTEPHKAFRPKALRKEALDMLSDLAVRRLTPRPGESSTLGRPRKVSDGRSGQGQGHAAAPPAASLAQQRARTQSFGDQLSHRSLELIASSQAGVRCSLDRDESPLVDLVDSTVSSSSLSSLTSSCANSVVERPRRPECLELSAAERSSGRGASAGGSAPTWHLQRLTLPNSPGRDAWASDGKSTEFASLPCEAASPDDVDAGAGGGAGARAANFNYRNPAYQSAHIPCRAGARGARGGQAGAAPSSDARGGELVMLQESTQDVRGVAEGRTGLLKWKGVVFTPEDDDVDSASSSPLDDTASQSTIEDGSGQVFTVELNRGWNSRLGFSLQSCGDHTVISAIYSDSVAAKNGKLKTGDRVIMVNDESVQGMPTPDVIDLFRKIRGPIAISVWREIQL